VEGMLLLLLLLLHFCEVEDTLSFAYHREERL
jgi:hypothetical protein